MGQLAQFPIALNTTNIDNENYGYRWDGTNFDISSSGRVLWIPVGLTVTTSGYIQASRPATSSTITVWPSTTRTWTASGITLSAWETLYYAPDLGSVDGSGGTWIICLNSNLLSSYPIHWFPIATCFGDGSLNGSGRRGKTHFGSWTGLSYVNSWANSAGSYELGTYRKDENGFVHLRGILNGSSATANTVATLPIGFRPEYIELHKMRSGSGFGRIDISSAGVITTAERTTTMTISGVVFRAYN